MVVLPGQVTSRAFTVHFDADTYESVTCKDCWDYRTGQCEGKGYRGLECYDCIVKHAAAAHEIRVH